MTDLKDQNVNHLNVLIIGCGNIAGGFDATNETITFPYTHAGAYLKDGRFNIIACIDPDDACREKFMIRWNVLFGFRTIDDILKVDLAFDVISICSPTSFHSEHIKNAINLKPKLIFCEKPITDSIEEIDILVEKCKKSNILLMVNYTRRWDPYILELKNQINNGQRGLLRSIVAYYNKGILNNGSHIIDLLHFLLGPLRLIDVGKPILDFFPNDPTIPVFLETLIGLPIYLAPGYAKDYSIFEIQFIFSEGSLVMEDGGLSWLERRVINSDTFKDYRLLNKGDRHAGSYQFAMLKSVDNIYLAIKKGEEIVSTGESALEAYKLCSEIKKASLILMD